LICCCLIAATAADVGFSAGKTKDEFKIVPIQNLSQFFQ
jgi:hypothetical protein